MNRMVAITAVGASLIFAGVGYAQDCLVNGRSTDRFVIKVIIKAGGESKSTISRECTDLHVINGPGYHELDCYVYQAVEQ